MTSATQFAARCLGVSDYAPPRRHSLTGALCWLCGGVITRPGWPLRTIVTPTFTNHNRAKAPTSDAVCQACAYFASKETWTAYVEAHPDMHLKTGHAMSWRCYSHAFWGGHHECPTRQRWQTLLSAPPPPPFMFVVATSGQKHLLFRAVVAQDAHVFPVQFEEYGTIIRRMTLVRLLPIISALLEAGCPRQDILSGRYRQAVIQAVGIARWPAMDVILREARTHHPLTLALGVHVGQKSQIGRT